jgi:hypothetical protein
MSRFLKCAAPLFLTAFFASSSFASTVLCTESADGCIAAIPTSSPVLFVASDGENTFRPFGVTVDTSDAIQLNSNWVANNDTGAFNTGFWQQLPNTFVWFLPASTPCGNENEPGCEPIGSWYVPGAQWLPGTPDDLVILDGAGQISDRILVNNNGPGGSAQILFSSDPNIIPEPASMGLVGLGIAALVYRVRSRR